MLMQAVTNAVPEQRGSIHHIAVTVENIAIAVDWYDGPFRCEIECWDETWAMLKFANASLTLVMPGDPQPHLGFVTPAVPNSGLLRTHRDGMRSTYISDADRNAIELPDQTSV